MPLLIPYDLGGLEAKTRAALDDIIARIQAWAGKVDGINAAERLSELTTGLASVPTPLPGFFQPYGGATAPIGWLLCDGSAVSRSTYANLFAVTGTTYGAGDGTNTFNIPDGRGRYFMGKATSGTGSTLGGTFGTIDHTHTGPSHTHPVTGSTGSNGAHTHTMSGSTASGGQVNGDDQVQTGTGIFVVGSVPTHTHGVGTLATGSDGAHTHAAGTLATSADGTGNTGTANPPTFVGHWLVKT